MSRLFPPINKGVNKNANSSISTSADYGYHIFDNGGGYFQAYPLPILAEGAVVKSRYGWYMKFRGSLTPINLCDIPNEVKTTILLLGLEL